MQIVSQCTWLRHVARILLMLKVPVASTKTNLLPAIAHLDNLSHPHHPNGRGNINFRSNPRRGWDISMIDGIHHLV